MYLRTIASVVDGELVKGNLANAGSHPFAAPTKPMMPCPPPPLGKGAPAWRPSALASLISHHLGCCPAGI